mmetsp:Transcript_102209/g.202907  ORF Transcript_102209/g.202907 Transcript_102209/m.202907 type:complete len:209 (+) Transcript_102209:480-1106(+)
MQVLLRGLHRWRWLAALARRNKCCFDGCKPPPATLPCTYRCLAPCTHHAPNRPWGTYGEVWKVQPPVQERPARRSLCPGIQHCTGTHLQSTSHDPSSLQGRSRCMQLQSSPRRTSTGHSLGKFHDPCSLKDRQPAEQNEWWKPPKWLNLSSPAFVEALQVEQHERIREARCNLHLHNHPHIGTCPQSSNRGLNSREGTLNSGIPHRRV